MTINILFLKFSQDGSLKNRPLPLSPAKLEKFEVQLAKTNKRSSSQDECRKPQAAKRSEHKIKKDTVEDAPPAKAIQERKPAPLPKPQRESKKSKNKDGTAPVSTTTDRRLSSAAPPTSDSRLSSAAPPTNDRRLSSAAPPTSDRRLSSAAPPTSDRRLSSAVPPTASDRELRSVAPPSSDFSTREEDIYDDAYVDITIDNDYYETPCNTCF